MVDPAVWHAERKANSALGKRALAMFSLEDTSDGHGSTDPSLLDIDIFFEMRATASLVSSQLSFNTLSIFPTLVLVLVGVLVAERNGERWPTFYEYTGPPSPYPTP